MLLGRRRPGPQLLVKARAGPTIQSNFTLNVNGQDFPCSKETLQQIIKNPELDFKSNDKLSITVNFDSSINLQEDKKLKNLIQSILNGYPTFIGLDPNLKAFIDYLQIENFVSKDTLEQLANEMERLTNLDTFFLQDNVDINNEDERLKSSEQSIDDETLIRLLIGLVISDHEHPDKYIQLMLEYVNKRGKTFLSNLKRVTLNILKSAVENGTEVKMIHEIIFIIRRLYEEKIIREIDFDLNLGNRLLPATFIDIVKSTNRQPFSIFNDYFDILKDNHYEAHKNLCHKGVNPDDIYNLMRVDDLEGFIQLTSTSYNTIDGNEKTFDYNKENYMKSAYERCSFVNNDYMCYIDICAFFGSVNIFKYLLNEKQARLTSKTAHYAVASGNKEIIQICEQNNLSFDGTLTDAIQFHHKEILEWLITEKKLPISNCFDTLISTCLQFASFPILKYLFELVESHEHDELSLNCANAIEQSCKWGISPSLKYLLHHTLISKPFKGDTINAFHMACQNGNSDIISTLIHQPFVDVNNKVMSVMSKEGWTGLHFAASKGNSAAISVLLQCDNLDVNAKTENNQTALHLACQRSVTSTIALLINHPKTIINIPVNQTNLLPLHICCQRGNAEAVELILNSNKDYGDINSFAMSEQLTPLHLACIQGNRKVVSLLSQVPNIDLNLKDKDNHTPLHLACINNRPECVKVLTEQNGIDANVRCKFHFNFNQEGINQSQSENGSESSSTSGQYAFSVLKKYQNKQQDSFNLPLDKSAETEVPLSPIGPLPSDTNFSEQTTSESLLKINTRTSIADFNYDEEINCLFYSALSANLKLFQSLVQHPDMDINLQEESGMTVLHICCYLGLVDFVRLLLFRENLEKNPVNKDGMTPLHLAACEGHAEVVKALTTTFGVDLNPKANRDQMTPLHYACEKGRTNVVAVLCEAKGVNMQEKTESGKTPIQIACAHGFSDIFAILSQNNNDMSTFRRSSHDSRKPQFGFFSPPSKGPKRMGFGPGKGKHSLPTTTGQFPK